MHLLHLRVELCKNLRNSGINLLKVFDFHYVLLNSECLDERRNNKVQLFEVPFGSCNANSMELNRNFLYGFTPKDFYLFFGPFLNFMILFRFAKLLESLLSRFTHLPCFGMKRYFLHV